MSSVPSRGAAFAASAEGYLDTIDTILQQFMDCAGSSAKETPVVGDLNALIADLAASFAGLGHEATLDLGDIEPFRVSPDPHDADASEPDAKRGALRRRRAGSTDVDGWRGEHGMRRNRGSRQAARQ
ncbi:hypothetical protein [Caballeronia grimmiae]|uniref:hypothetical protein n=1 Tax=Caballeronia grimmiae TaxID=1071679 RepID=UPI000AC84980|nr:hypothetical protein [Caballeronia grimmiae]